MKLKMDKDMVWNLILTISIILIVSGFSNTGDSDKKTAQVAQGQAGVGVAGVAAFGLKRVGFLAAAAAPIVYTLGAIFVFFGNKLTGFIADIFNPSPGIPSWVWIGAFFIIALMVLRGKRN